MIVNDTPNHQVEPESFLDEYLAQADTKESIDTESLNYACLRNMNPGSANTGQTHIAEQNNKTNVTGYRQEILHAVEEYQSRGVQTFPLNREKIPLVKEWNDHDFTIEQHRVNGFHGIGTCPGRWPGNIMVFDVDGPKGRESWAKCLEKYGPLPDTFTVTTGREEGGEHLYFQAPDGLYVKSTTSKFAKKVDIRGTRGQAVLPPTVHKSGRVYQWHHAGEPCEIPDPEKIPLLPEPWVEALIDTDNAYFPGQGPAKPVSCSQPFNGNIGQYARAALETEILSVAQAPEGTRNDTLNKAAFSLGQLIAGGELDQSTVENELMAAATGAGLGQSESTKTIRSGMKAGAKSPRRAPEPIHNGTGKCDTCDTTITEASHRKAFIDGDCDTCDTCDAISDDKKTFSLPEPPLDCFPPEIESAIRNIAETKQCPVEVPLSAFLALGSGMVGRARCITIKRGWSETGNLYIGVVAKSGVGKSPATNTVFKPVYQIDKENQEQYEQEMEAYELALEAWKKIKKNPGPKPKPPQKKDIILDDWTIESVADSLISNPKGVLLYRDELAGTLLDMDKYAGEKGSTKTRLLTAYDAKKPWKITRINSQRVGYIPNPCVSLYGGIQDQVACQLFSKTDQDSGFLGRFIFIQATQKKPALFSDDEETDGTIQTIELLVRGLEKIDLVDGKSKYIGVTKEAKAIYIAWHDALSREAWLSMDDSETGLLSKVRAQGLRICLLLHIIEKIMMGEDEMDAVLPDTMIRALTLMDWLRAHTQATWKMLKQKAQAPTGQDVRVAQAILSIEDQIEGGWLSTNAITDQTNKGQDEKFHLQSDKVGRICSSLGLKGKRRRVCLNPGQKKKEKKMARGVLITPDDLNRLSEYLPTNIASHVSQVSQAFNDGDLSCDTIKNMCHMRHTTDAEETLEDVEFF